MSTPSLLLGKSITWPLEAMTVKPLPRNFISVRDLVGDSTITRVLPVASTDLLEAARAGLMRGRLASGSLPCTPVALAIPGALTAGFFAARFPVAAPGREAAFAAGAFATGAFAAGALEPGFFR